MHYDDETQTLRAANDLHLVEKAAEPGLYFREDDLLIPPEYRGIGIRIEDDVLMTENGPEWISAGIPKQIDDVEAWMAEQAAQAK